MPSISLHDLTADGATTTDVIETLQLIEHSADSTLFTITVGGNDLLAAAHMFSGESPVVGIVGRLAEILRRLLLLRPNADVLLATVYDPTDASYLLPYGDGSVEDLRAFASWFETYNDEVRRIVTTDRRLHLADIHEHFLGHGSSDPSVGKRWFWEHSLIEPNVRGASEVRRLWINTVEALIAMRSA